ncbi:SDR family NAD(P)-dependent oxidoreductase [Neobacillus rhizophilus]|uniref:Glucose 1-dehydrogenase n=1 Tax=Neobacillus rhizophilus TaxID=2833579 RepID=A0A942UAN0_9BACI|nr:glucose 1-dehydrogenase [Neobacillus rhizophilus]MBS4214624.1 glucose 1-dehydrogenase [Neobacillus rhizophilus]MBU8918526.1 glucose 1-dehydrogenase [Bacillus sp. FJAT-29953]
MTEKRLENKVAIITGAANGIGREEAILFAENGAKVVVTDINEEALQKTVEAIRMQGGEAIGIRHDVSVEEDWQEVILKTEAEFGQLDILLNNAAILSRNGLAETTVDEFLKIQSVNSAGTFLGMKYGAALIKKTSGKGSIINTSSGSGLVGTPGSTAYHASKGAVRLMTKSAALELAKDFIRVNSIHPGVIETAMSGGKDGKHFLSEKIPMKCLGKPIDIAYGALYLASDESRFVTGSELIIDGGYTAQ